MNKGKLANNVFFLSLLCIFVVCSLFVVSYQIIGYRSIVKKNEKSDETHIPLAYLSNKVKANDAQGMVYIENKEGSDVLVLESEKRKTYIYVYQKRLMELQATKDYAFQFSDGDILCAVDELNIEKQDNLLIFQVRMKDKTMTLNTMLHSKGGK
ncbi:MAG: DUF4860 domain-containing protein [Erysipelotrichia bacterium]|nr:DUF4860 domain-containing protein [Erysipelotrichia bacterium]NCC54433.1 DUF4860 domain-containing protein [Erysipelotrichia bacterium]